MKFIIILLCLGGLFCCNAKADIKDNPPYEVKLRKLSEFKYNNKSCKVMEVHSIQCDGACSSIDIRFLDCDGEIVSGQFPVHRGKGHYGLQ